MTAMALAKKIETLPEKERAKLVALVHKLANGKVVDMGLALSVSCPAEKLASHWAKLPHLAPADADAFETDLSEARSRLIPAVSRWE